LIKVVKKTEKGGEGRGVEVGSVKASWEERHLAYRCSWCSW
jgi:hypothetical protein